MNLRHRLNRGTGNGHAAQAGGGALLAVKPGEGEPDRYQVIKKQLHREMIGKIDLAQLEGLADQERRAQVERVARRLLEESEIRLTRSDEERLLSELLHDTFDLGPITPLLLDEEVSDILVNTHRQVFVERLGKLEQTSITFRDDAHLRLIIERIISRVGRRIDESNPLVDARLPDGSRVNAIIPPAALDGAILSIRRFRRKALAIDHLIELDSLTTEIAQLLTAAVRVRLNVLVTGGTGSGKTTLLNILSRYISNEERIITVEDSAELMLQQPHVVRLETRPPNVEGKGQITQRDLVKNALRMRPDRIIVGEVRGDEVLDMLQAMNTGHDGSLTTLHSNGPRDALHRLENLVLMAGHNLPDRAIREQVSSAIDLLVHVSRLSDGTRKILSVQEVLGMDGAVVTMQEIFRFVQTGIGESGRVDGFFEATGIVPRCLDRLRVAGVVLPNSTFERGREIRGSPMILVFAILVFLAVVMLAAGFFIERSGSGTRLVAERLKKMSGRAKDAGSGVERDASFSRVGWLDAALRGLNVGQHLEMLLYQAGMNVRAGGLVLAIAGVAMGGYFIGVAMLHRVLPGIVLMALLAPVPYVYVVFRKHKRMKAFAREFPDALDLLVSGLRAGLSLSAAMQILAEESPEPVRSEFAITVEENTLGLDFREAMVNLTKRVDVMDLRFFVTAVLLQRETGGNLAEVLSNTASLIRERFRVLGDIQTFTAQGKMTGVILVLLPIGVGLFTWLTAPDYFAPMIQSSAGRTGLMTALWMQLAGILVILRIVNIKV